MTPRFLDAHLHLWDLQKLSYPWMADPELGVLRQDYLPHDFRRDTAELDVAGVVHVQAEMDHAADPVLETAWLAELATDTSAGPAVPTACVAYADLRDPNLADVLDRHAAYPFLRGIRQEAWCDPHSTRADILTVNLLEDPAWVRGLKVLADRDLSFELLVFPQQLALAADVFAQLPELTVLLGHTGVPDPATDPGLELWRAGVTRFAHAVPQAVLKLSGMGFVSGGAAWAARDLAPLVRECIDLYGPDRCLFASNWPVERLATPRYADVWAGYDEMTADLGESERAALFAGTAARVYGIPLAADPPA
jgi:predicted TIM-barrel fold metal-dependent hydrolase